MIILSKKKQLLVGYIVVYVGLIFFYNLYLYANLGPCSVHAWRQSDSAAFALQYFNKSTGFFSPYTLNLGSIEGRACSEFPIVYYIVGQLYKIFGPSEAVFRSFSCLVIGVGVFAMAKIIFALTEDVLLSLLIASCLLVSPMLIFYGFGYIPNPIALSMLFCGWYFCVSYKNNPQNKSIVLAFFFLTLSCLIKITSLIAILPIFFVWCWDVSSLKKRPQIFLFPRFQFLVLVGIVLLSFVWVLYSKWYNGKYESYYFLTSIKPLWESNESDARYILKRTLTEWFPVVFHKSMFVFAFGGLVFSMIYARKVGTRVTIYWVLLLLLTMIIIILWYQQLIVHDYYIIDWMPIIGLILIITGYLIHVLKIKKWAILPLLILLAYNAAHTKNVLKERYRIDNPDRKGFNQSFYKVKELRKYMDSIGITRDKKIISLRDVSVQISLYFMNREGWTNINIGDNPNYNVIDEYKSKGAEYLVISDEKILKDSIFNQKFQSRIGEFNGNIFFYKIP